MNFFILSAFFIQGIAMFFDEFYYHQKRGLPRWEKIGHPLDTLSTLSCFLFLYILPPTERNLIIYAGLAVFSCLFITKDEVVHAKECSPGEQWLHSILFILHPITLIAAVFIWPLLHTGTPTTVNLVFTPENLWAAKYLPLFILGQIVLIIIFMIYQITYWNFYAKDK